MNNCQNCPGCRAKTETKITDSGSFALVGNMNVGKSTLFARFKKRASYGINIPGTTVSVVCSSIKNTNYHILDTPGICSIFANNEDERASRDILLLPKEADGTHGIILVADAKHLKRSIAIALQYCEYGLPMVFALNMIDEADARGIEINPEKLANILGIDVIPTIATSGMGVDQLTAALDFSREPSITINYPEDVTTYLKAANDLLGESAISSKAIALLLLTDDPAIEDYICAHFSQDAVKQLKDLARIQQKKSLTIPEIYLGNVYYKEADKIISQVMTTEPPSKNSFIVNFGDWCTKISTGVPIALAILAIMYLFVGTFGATFLVDNINSIIFQNYVIPWSEKLLSPLPVPFLRDMIIDPDFGILPTGVFLAVGLVAPVIFCFYLAFGFLENSGYLPRISLLLDRVFQLMGLNGKGVIPLVMGFSCVTMALLTTRILNTEKEKNIASFLLFLCMPCAPLIAVMLIILEDMPISATIFVFGFIFIQLIFAGYLSNKILPGNRTPLMMEIPAMRIPKPWPLIKMASAKTYYFMKEAMPIFIYASIAVFIFQRIGGLALLEKSLGPLIGKILGLPEESIQVFIKTIIRRESGAAELEHIHGIYSNLQLVVNLLVMTFIAPCLNAIMVLFKERGTKAAGLILLAVTIYATLLGSIVNYSCQWLGITFT